MQKLIVFIAGIIIATSAVSQEKATTEDGKRVLLFKDGTWKENFEFILDCTPDVMKQPSFSGQTLKKKSKLKQKIYKVESERNAITVDESWFYKYQLRLKEHVVQRKYSRQRSMVPMKSPKSFLGAELVRMMYDDNYTYFVFAEKLYVGRYLVVMNPSIDSVAYCFDFESYISNNNYVKEDKSYVNQSIQWAQIEEGILYVQHNHRTYASSSNNENAYITAIDLKTNELIWRTKSLVANAHNFLINEEFIVCGYGFTGEKDYLITLDKKTGAVIEKYLLKTGPEYIIFKNGQYYVRCYDTNYVFEIR
jgi:hypothetical protein